MPRAILTVAGGAIDIRLNNSRTAADLLAQLPLTLQFRAFGGQERKAGLPRPLDLTGVPTGSSAGSGDFGYSGPPTTCIMLACYDID